MCRTIWWDFFRRKNRFSVADYVRHAGECIAQITARGRVPIVAGGTGLYISSLVNGIDFTPDKADPPCGHGWKPS